MKDWSRAGEPNEDLPQIGTAEGPAYIGYRDAREFILSYEIAPVGGGGIAIVRFGGLFEFSQLPVTSESLGDAGYPVKPWSITEVWGSGKTMRWNSLAARFWTVSFDDQLLEIVFRDVELLRTYQPGYSPDAALLDFLKIAELSN